MIETPPNNQSDLTPDPFPAREGEPDGDATARLEPAESTTSSSDSPALPGKGSGVRSAGDAPSPEPRTWEDDETGATLFLRATFTLLAGAFLLWAQCRAPATWATLYGVSRIGDHWNRWVAPSIVANFLLPLGIIWMFFGQG